MTVFWDQGDDAEQLRAAAHRNGHTTVVRLDFTLDIRTRDQAILSVNFDELEQRAVKAIAYRQTYIQPIQPPQFRAWTAHATGDDLIANVCRFLDEQCNEDFTWSYETETPTRRPRPKLEPLDVWRGIGTAHMPGTPTGLAPVTDITVRFRK